MTPLGCLFSDLWWMRSDVLRPHANGKLSQTRQVEVYKPGEVYSHGLINDGKSRCSEHLRLVKYISPLSFMVAGYRVCLLKMFVSRWSSIINVCVVLPDTVIGWAKWRSGIGWENILSWFIQPGRFRWLRLVLCTAKTHLPYRTVLPFVLWHGRTHVEVSRWPSDFEESVQRPWAS